jgi:serine/threonine-protein kinase
LVGEAAGERDEFESRWRSTGLSATAIGLGVTIRSEPAEDRGAAAAPPPASSAPDPRRVPGPLPRVSLALTTTDAGAAASASSDLVVLSRLGEGGMGAVDLAWQRSLARDVAVKRMRDGAVDPRAAVALLNEGRTTGALEHPGIVPVHALGVDDAGSPVLVMKRIEGVSWADLVSEPAHPLWATLAPGGQDRVAAHVEILRQTCNALAFAHSRGVIHRDLKPENVMIGAFGEVYLLDWGVALQPGSLTEAERAEPQLCGTPCFLPPEMFGGLLGDQDERSDVYLLGATLHAVLTGRPRHEGATLQQVMLAAWTSAPVAYPPSVPDELAALCNAATERDPARRPGSVAAFRQRLAEYVQHRGSTALARSAREALDQAQALPKAEGPEGRTVASPDAWRLMSEARFGFVQALREWPENPLGRAGLQACVEALVERELALRSPEGARALLGELLEARPALRDGLERLEAELASEKAHATQGRREAREMDKSVSARTRALVFVVGLITSLISGFVALPQGEDLGRVFSMRYVVTQDLIMLVVVAAALLLGRRRLFGNRVSRHLSVTMVIMLLSGTAADLVSWRFDGDLHLAIAQKFLAGTGALAVGGITVDRNLLLPAGILLSAVALMAAWPAGLAGIASAASLLGLLALIWAAWQQSRSPGDPPAGVGPSSP